MAFPLLYSVSDRGQVEARESLSDIFPLEGYLHKLKHKASLLGGAWNRRYFVVEERRGKSTAEWYFSYYQDGKKTDNVKDSGDAVLLQSISHVSLLATSGRLALYTSPASLLDEKSKKELLINKDLIFEVETPGRVYFLRAETRYELMRWASGLQRMCGLRVDVAWPAGVGELPWIPEQVLRARMAENSLPPELDKILRPHLMRPLAARSPTPPAATSSVSPTAAVAVASKAVASKVADAAPVRSAGGSAPQSPAGGARTLTPTGFPATSATSAQPPLPQPLPVAARSDTVAPRPFPTAQSSAVAPNTPTTMKPCKAKEDLIIEVDEDDTAVKPILSGKKERSSSSALPVPIDILQSSSARAAITLHKHSGGASKAGPDPRTKQGLLEAAIASAARRASDTSVSSESKQMAEPASRKFSEGSRPHSATGSIADNFDDEDDSKEDSSPKVVAVPSVKGIAATGHRNQVSATFHRAPTRSASGQLDDVSSPAASSWMHRSVDEGFSSNKVPAPQKTVAPVEKPRGVVGEDRNWDDWDESPSKAVSISRLGGAARAPERQPAPQADVTATTGRPAGVPPSGPPVRTAVALVRGSLHAKAAQSGAINSKKNDAGVATDKDFVKADWDT